MGNLVEIKNLEIEYQSSSNILGKTKTVKAVNNITINIKEGEILSVAGESGCGKSTLAKALMKLTPVKSGKINFKGDNILKIKNLKDYQNYYKQAQMIFQNPYASLNPKMKIEEILSEPLIINTKLSKKEISEIIKDKIQKVGLNESCLKLYPHEFSGGQRQRIAIAKALVLSPQFIIADEPVSALDVSIQAQIINLLKELKEDFNLTFLFISHDMGVIKYISDRVAIMYLGEIVEIGTTDEIFKDTKHPYTKALLSAVPQVSTTEDKKERISLSGELPNPEDLPKGCKFHTRCPYVMDKCKTKQPVNKNFSDTHFCKCFLYE